MTGLGHSPLGASGAYRWMACPGSVGLSQGIVDPESEHAALGTAAHAVAAQCLLKGLDAWQAMGEWVTDDCIVVDKEMADAVQVYLNHARARLPGGGQRWVERPFHCPSLHRLFYGTSDLTDYYADERLLVVGDYKHGAGIVVEVENNPQLMYYACGMLESLDLWSAVDTVTLHVCQPRGFHFDGPIRSWSISVPELEAWLFDVLLPAMDKALVSHETKSGEHCRFCPARGHACPQILSDLEELTAMLAAAEPLTNEQLGRFLDLLDVAKIAGKKHADDAFGRLQAGQAVPGRKLANARSNRIWKPEAAPAIQAKFGTAAFTEPELKSPAQIEALPEGAAITAQWAFKPDAGLTVVKSSDTRTAVSRDTKSLFAATAKTRKKAS